MTEKQQEYLKKVLDRNSKDWKNQRKEVLKATGMMLDFLRYIKVLPEDIEKTYTDWVDKYTDLMMTKAVEQLSDEDLKCIMLFDNTFSGLIKK